MQTQQHQQRTPALRRRGGNGGSQSSLHFTSEVDTVSSDITITKIVADIFQKLGQLPEKVSTKVTKDLISELTKDFHEFRKKYDELETAYRRLEADFQQEWNISATVRSKLEEREKLTDYITTVMDRQTKHLQEAINTSIATSMETQAGLPFTYAETVQFPPLPTKEKPSLIVTSKTDEIPIKDLQKTLNKLDMREIPSVECVPTRNGKLILSCDNQQDLENVKAALESHADINDVAKITQKKPRRMRVILFGAPEAPPPPKKDEEEQDTSYQSYIQNRVKPALLRALRKNDVQFKLIRVLRSRKNEGTSHLVLELNEKDAYLLLATKVGIGFNTCAVKRYATVIRCYKCQKIGHYTRVCQNEEACAYCAGCHNINDCPKTEQPSCVNCMEEAIAKGGVKEASVHPNHPSNDNRCMTYSRALQSAIHALKPLPKNIQTNSGKFTK